MTITNKHQNLAISVLWLFHISGIIGISLGYKSWFMPKTSINLLVLLGIVILTYNLLNSKSFVLFFLVSIIGFFAEVLGVNYGWFFGDYKYGENLGVKLLGVPLLIGINWGILSLVTAKLASYITPKLSLFFQAFIGASLMLLLDFFMEASAPKFDFWRFDNSTVPLSNYIAWFAFAYIFNLTILHFKVLGNFKIALNIYIAQLIFFIYFYVYF
ncbi:carotenoid biosynthesis protein [Psychroflexus sp. ALD_RP9]|uniref:carotenoid biosynthesis protein n=1 Tax=Psychroflexus sp. ALD_RP9 TaxID=2777186 RepID=UPI001A90B3F2|nr:carotenoid biosynthesis protein [Psychroflexus sp. ALD_RP9]QSS97574.1 carotenoid biosynthesis protein [Psychroflexus sp. ALD_RP9]